MGIGSLVGGVLPPLLCDQATERVLSAAEEFRARKSVKRDSGVFGGSISDEERAISDLYFALDAFKLETEAADFWLLAFWGPLNQSLLQELLRRKTSSFSAS